MKVVGSVGGASTYLWQRKHRDRQLTTHSASEVGSGPRFEGQRSCTRLYATREERIRESHVALRNVWPYAFFFCLPGEL